MGRINRILDVCGFCLFCQSLNNTAQEVECNEGCPSSMSEARANPAERGHVLLQVHATSRTLFSSRPTAAKSATLEIDRNSLPQTAESRNLFSAEAPAALSAQLGISREVLPEDLRELGIELAGSEMHLDELVWNSRLEHVVYAGVPLMLRMVTGDFSNGTLVEEGSGHHHLYGLDRLEQLRKKPPEQDRINMIDLGGNYGAVSIAAFKLYPDSVRAVTVEPIPSTYFFLRWNMWLNGVPALEQHDLTTDKSVKTGVLALNQGVVRNTGDLIDFCYTPPLTMNAMICSCLNADIAANAQRRQVPGITMETLVNLFGSSPITLAKVDCEGCEFSTLPAVRDIIAEDPDRFRRLAGELHFPSRDIEDVACRFDMGQFFVRLCATPNSLVEGMPLSCDEHPVSCAHLDPNANNECFVG